MEIASKRFNSMFVLSGGIMRMLAVLGFIKNLEGAPAKALLLMIAKIGSSKPTMGSKTSKMELKISVLP